MGGREVGGMANLLAAHRDLASEEDRQKVSEHWGGGVISDKPGLTAMDQVEALESGKLKAIWIICTNPSVSIPNSKRFAKALEKARFVIVQDISKQSDTVDHADLILPAAGWLEKQGTMTNSERRVSYLPKVLDAPGEAKPDFWILQEFAKRMGWTKNFNYKDESNAFDEHAKLTQDTAIDITGLNYERLKTQGTLQ